MAKDVSIVDKKKEINHEINLQDTNQSLQLVLNSYIDIPSKTRFLGLSSSDPDVKYKMAVKYTADSKLVISKNSPLLVLSSGGECKSEIQIHATTCQVPFQMMLDPNQIIDCEDVEKSTEQLYKIQYEISLAEIDGKDGSVTVNGELNVKFNPIALSAPIFSFEPTPLGRELIYTNQDQNAKHIGNLIIKNSGNLLRCPSCSISFDLGAVRKKNGELEGVTGLVKMGSEITQTHPRVFSGPDKAGIKPLGKDASEFMAKVNPSSAVLNFLYVNKSREDSLINDNYVSIPLYWDMALVNNPVEPVEEYILSIKANYGFADTLNSAQTYSDSNVIKLHKNKVMMSLDVKFTDGVLSESISADSAYKSSIRIPEMVPGAATHYSLELVNTAEFTDVGKEDAKIYVKDFSVQVPVAGVCYTEVAGDKQEHVFIIEEKSDLKESEDVIIIPVRGKKKFQFSYDHTCINKIYEAAVEKYETNVIIPVSFAYYVDKDVDYNAASEIPEELYTKFETRLRIKIRKAPKPEWVCLDFGTSAVVTSFGRGFYDEHGVAVNRLLPLKDTKQRQFKKWYSGDKTLEKYAAESDDNLINSSIIVTAGRTKLEQIDIENAITNINDYKASVIQFSPLVDPNALYTQMIPSLKALMGNKNLPERLLPLNVKSEKPISVDKLFGLVYKQLFTHFLPDEVRQTNKAIFTIPNTYAPVHVDIIRKLALELLPELRPDYTRFLSESDAVAFYYLAKRPEFIRSSKDNGWHGAKNFDQKILVYDMGAGTLDLTYLVQDKQGDKTHIHIEGKMGVSRAGNYLDYVLADIVVSLLSMKVPNLVSELQQIVSIKGYSTESAIEAGKLKNYVRNSLKPILNHSKEEALPAYKFNNVDMPMDQITIGDVLEHEEFKKFLKEVTDEVFTNFKNLFTSGDKNVSPSLIIFSGRTTCLTALRQAVKESLLNLGIVSNNCTYLDLAGGIYSSDIQTAGDKISNLKTAVVDGALAFCSDFAVGKGDYILHNKNVFAQYGLMLRVNQTWVWENLIDTHTQPIKGDDETINQDGFSIYEYDSSIHDASEIYQLGTVDRRIRTRNFSGISAAYVIQSYSNNTEQDWRDSKIDMMSIIGYVDLTNVEGEKTYKLTIDENNQIHFWIGSGTLDLYAHDEYTAPSFIKSMWPIVKK